VLPTITAPSVPSRRPRRALDQVERHRGRQQPQRLRLGKIEPAAQRLQRLRAFGEDVEQAHLHAGQQHLRVDEAGHQIEQAARAAPGDRTGERECGCEAVESGAAEQLIAPHAPLVPPGRRVVSGAGFGHRGELRVHRATSAAAALR
jgi:hypothetical protein